MTLYQRIFGKNDWAIVWFRIARYKYKNQGLWEDSWSFSKCQYHIMFSPSRNRYKLISKGYGNKHTRTYKEAVDTYNHYTNQL